MESRNHLLLSRKDIDPKYRPKLDDMLAIAEGSAYILSSEILSALPGDERLTVLIKSGNSIGIIEDIPANPEEGTEEKYRTIVLDDIATATLAELISPPKKNRKESTGRPPKYSLEQEGTDIFIQHVYEGQSIKSIAEEHHMSPTTVQKLLNRSRLQAADNFVNGIWPLSKDSINWEKNLKLLQWAIQHSTGIKRQQYETLLYRVK